LRKIAAVFPKHEIRERRKGRIRKKYNTFSWALDRARDCNPGLEFSIPGFGIVEFPIPGSRDPVGIGVV